MVTPSWRRGRGRLLALAHVVGTVAPVALGFVLQVAGVGGLVGTALALRLRLRRRHVDCWTVVAAWMTLGAGIALAIVLCALLSG